MAETETGWVVQADLVALGDALVGDHLAGVTTLTVEDAGEFYPDGGQLRIGATTYTYTAADVDTGVITGLDPVLGADADDGESVFVVEDDVVASELRVLVELADDDPSADAIPATVKHSLVPLIPEGARIGRGEQVLIEVVADEWWVVDVLGKAPALDAGYVDPATVPLAGWGAADAATVAAIEADVAAAYAAIEAGDSANSAAINAAIDDFNAGLATKSQHTLSPNPPGSTANNAGDVWEQHKAGDSTLIIGRWRGAGGTSWTVMDLDATYIPQLDIGTGTFGDLSGSRILAHSIGVDRLLVGSFDNLLSDPTFEVDLGEAWSTFSGGAVSTTAARNGGRALQITNAASQQATYNQPEDVPCEAGTYFHVAMWVKQTTTIPSSGIRIGVRWRLANGSTSTAFIANDGASGRPGSIGANTWTRLSGVTTTAPANTVSVSFFLSSESSNSSGTFYCDFASVTKAASGELIVDGSIQTKHLHTDFVEALLVTGDVLQTSASANTGIKISNSGLVAYDGSTAVTTLDASTGVVTARKLQTGASGTRVVVADTAYANEGQATVEWWASGYAIPGRIITSGSVLKLEPPAGVSWSRPYVELTAASVTASAKARVGGYKVELYGTEIDLWPGIKLGAGSRVSALDFGRVTAGNSDTNGRLVVSHTLGTTPSAVILTGGSTEARHYYVYAIGASNFTVQVRDTNHANLDTADLNFFWLAIA